MNENESTVSDPADAAKSFSGPVPQNVPPAMPGMVRSGMGPPPGGMPPRMPAPPGGEQCVLSELKLNLCVCSASHHFNLNYVHK